MKRLLSMLALAALVLSLNSCGLPVALARTVSRTVESLGGLAAPAAAAAL